MPLASWNILDGHCFHSIRISTLQYWIIQTFDQNDWNPGEIDAHIKQFDSTLRNQMSRRYRMDSKNVVRTDPDAALTTLRGKTLEERLQEAKPAGATLVILMLPSFDRYHYTILKDLADRKFGLRSICIAKPAQFDERSAKMYMTNIVQNINFKYGGVNSAVDGIDLSKTLILGADVVHPPVIAFEECPSIASMVGSVDAQGGRFLGSMRLQSVDKKNREVSSP
jgi:hypothetical protein